MYKKSGNQANQRCDSGSKYEFRTYTVANIYQKELDMVVCANVCAKYDEDGNVSDEKWLCKMYTFLF